MTLGGASVGDLDLVQKTALARGLALDFHKIAMRPGKPLMAGRLGAVPLVGLPGNPVSALVCAHLFLRPALARMLGLPGDPPPASRPASARLGANGPREHFMRAGSGPTRRLALHALRAQDSSLLTVLAEANALLVRAPLDSAADRGDPVEFIWL